ncbi:hypothetical protein HS041_28225 [Planomonospora sp. ID67723]|uniref:hypothetical protein n=1 Tax=Planomonospora sp. ID67723 TaxID=2738134 RepID=UPI0018C3FE67|nr:hypothetical protein [Planomonospora sp. ID67723]MBG0831622.1 hypothetical protein [Planomonospora sp. ID67723]
MTDPDPDPDPVDLELSRFMAELDPLMRGVLASEDVAQARNFVHEVKWHCTESPYGGHLWGAGGVYCIWAEIDDILDGWPLDYGSDTDALALREFKRAAQEWLDMPRTEAGLQDYVHQWETRMAEDTWPAPGGIPWRQRFPSADDPHGPSRP